MILARVSGHATSTVKHPSMQGCTLLLCEGLRADGSGDGAFFLAADYFGAGHGSTVMVTTDGSSAELHHGDPTSPIRNAVMGLVDEVQTDDAEETFKSSTVASKTASARPTTAVGKVKPAASRKPGGAA